MLDTLRIQNFALIETAEIEFRPGYNVLTGETGAGKSILMGALNLVLGARASSDAVRAGAADARVEAMFHLDRPSPQLLALLAEHEIDFEDNALLLARVVAADGRSKGYAGGRMVPISILAALGDELVDLHGQHEHQSLLRADRQLDLLDANAGAGTLAAQVSALVDQWRHTAHELETLEQDDRDRTRQIEFLQFEVNEIDEAGFETDEETSLQSRLNLITNSESIHKLAAEAYGLLYEGADPAAIDLLDRAGRAVEELAALDDRFKPLATQCTDLRNGLEAASEELREYTEALEFDPEELETLNQRRALLGKLKRKYGGSVEEILAYRAQAFQQLENFTRRDERIEELRAAREAQYQDALAAAKKLSTKRKQAARKLAKRVTANLQDLGMKGATFETQFHEADLYARGVDRAEFLLAANAGERAKALRQVASGGEISRIMLALKAVFAEADAIPTLVFDEIDAGVGGAVARQIAEKMRGLARTHQVICITHIAQIAAPAQTHFNVSKATVKGRTVSAITQVEHDERVAELARLLDGTLSDVSVAHARQMLGEQAS